MCLAHVDTRIVMQTRKTWDDDLRLELFRLSLWWIFFLFFSHFFCNLIWLQQREQQQRWNGKLNEKFLWNVVTWELLNEDEKCIIPNGLTWKKLLSHAVLAVSFLTYTTFSLSSRCEDDCPHRSPPNVPDCVQPSSSHRNAYDAHCVAQTSVHCVPSTLSRAGKACWCAPSRSMDSCGSSRDCWDVKLCTNERWDSN